jgi:hypothetical protein
LTPKFQFLEYSSATNKNQYWSGHLSIWKAPYNSVPETSSDWLMATGLAFMMLFLRKRKC